MAQIIALVAYSNVWLNSSGGAPELLHTNSTFQYVDTVKFAQYSGPEQEQGEEVAMDVAGGLTVLRSMGARRLWNIAFSWQRQGYPEYALAGFSNAIPKAIQVDLPHGCELWYPRWQTGGSTGKIWRVEYRGLMCNRSYAMPLVPLDQVKVYLRQALAQAEAFALRPEAGAASWAGWFTKALALLESGTPEPPFHPDMLPAGSYPPAARQILAAAVQANVFGGMGSWNDISFADPQMQLEYQSVTAALYEAVKTSTVIASNSFA